jgi:hypothetical protein
MSLSFRVL